MSAPSLHSQVLKIAGVAQQQLDLLLETEVRCCCCWTYVPFLSESKLYKTSIVRIDCSVLSSVDRHATDVILWEQAFANYAQHLSYYAMPALQVKPSYYAQYYA